MSEPTRLLLSVANEETSEPARLQQEIAKEVAQGAVDNASGQIQKRLYSPDRSGVQRVVEALRIDKGEDAYETLLIQK